MLNTEVGGRPYWTTVGQNVVESKESATLILDTGYQPFNASIVWGLADTELPAIRNTLWTQAGKPRSGRTLKFSFAIPQLEEVDDTASSNLRRSASAERRASVVDSDGARIVRPITPVKPMSDDDDDDEDVDKERGGSIEADLNWHAGLGFPPPPRRADSAASPRRSEDSQAPPLLHRMSPFRGERRPASPTPLDGDARSAPSLRSPRHHTTSSPRHRHYSSSRHGQSQDHSYYSDDSLDETSHHSPHHRRPLPAEFVADDEEVKAIFAVESTASIASLPAYAQPTARRAAALLRRKGERGGKEDVKALLEGFAAALPMDVKNDIYENKYWNLDKVNAYSQSAQPTTAVPSGLGDLFVIQPSASRRCATVLEWQRAWGEVTKLVVRLYNRREEMDAYQDFFLGFVLRNEGAFDIYYSVNKEFRKHLGEPGLGHTLTSISSSPIEPSRPHSIEPLPHPPSLRQARPRSPRHLPLAAKERAVAGTSRPTPKPSPPRYLPAATRASCSRASQSARGSMSAASAAAVIGLSTALREEEEEEEEREERWEESEAEPREHLLSRLASSEDPLPTPSLPGMREAPRLRRGLHYPSVPSIPNSLAIDSTLSASPFARVPSSVANDPIISATLAHHPHLFAISTLFNLVALRLLLRPHPNRPLVESVLHGLEHGFWPSHSGDFSKCRSIFPDLEDDDYDFLADVAQKEYDEGCLSEHFPSLLPGMLVSPSYVVNVPGRKRRQVVDQSASGLNDGISRADAKTSYDTIAELGALFRYLAASLPASSFPLGHLWKSDVSRAFRNIPVAKEWQLKQVHRVRLSSYGGGKVFVFTVDQRLILGGRLSPRIWCTVINLVMWIARYHFSLSHAFIFVDDGFSYDTSGLLVTINHPVTNEEMVVPMEQAKLLICWKVCGVPFDVKKQLHSDLGLEILGCWVDIASKSVTLPREKKEEFAAGVASFLGGLSPPLVEWQRIAGYAQWACYTAPLAKFALKPLYPKMAGKKLRNAPVPINKEVKTNLRWFADTILAAPPLLFLDPCLDEWSPREADAIYYSDACLVSNNGSSGLGFWTRRRSGAILDYFHRSPSGFEDIQLAEALAVASAIQHAVSCTPRPCRLLVYSDSAPSVYAFDAGRGSASLIALVWRAYTFMEKANVDFRIRHIAGDKNSRADRLSRLHPSELASDFPSLTSFSPPAWALGGDEP